jgi:hypothetical protein
MTKKKAKKERGAIDSLISITQDVENALENILLADAGDDREVAIEEAADLIDSLKTEFTEFEEEQ